MRNKNKILSGILALSAVACVSLGIAFQSDDAVNVSAADSTMSVNTLGYLEWAEVEGATSYEVDTGYGKFTVTENRANVGDALTKAAKAAYAQDDTVTSTEVEFTVTANDSANTVSTYTHTVESYIDYAFSTIDISEAKQFDGTILGNTSFQITSNKRQGLLDATYKNTLFSFGFSTSTNFGTSTAASSHFYLFANDDKAMGTTGIMNTAGTTYYTWKFVNRQKNIDIYVNGTGNPAETAIDVQLESLSVETIEAESTYAYSIGIFDTYGLGGGKVGETIYILREEIDTTNSTKTFHSEYSSFASNNFLANPDGDENTEDAVTNADYATATGFGWRSPKNYTYTLTSGKMSEDENAPLYEAKNLSLSLNGDIGVNMYADLNDVAKLNSDVAEMQITYKGETTTQVVPTAETVGAMAGYYKFSYAVAPKEIDETITARLVIPGGPIGEEVSYTVRDWVNSVKSAYETDNATYAKDYAMAMALEGYCDTAVTYFDTTAEQPEKNNTVVDFSEFAPTSTEWSGSVTLSGISLLAEANTTLRIYFKVDGEMPVVKVNGQEVTPETLVQGEDTFYYVEMKDISAKDLDEAYTFEFGEDNVSCSALTYGCTLTESSDAKSVNLLKALYAYNEVANTYFAQ